MRSLSRSSCRRRGLVRSRGGGRPEGNAWHRGARAGSCSSAVPVPARGRSYPPRRRLHRPRPRRRRCTASSSATSTAPPIRAPTSTSTRTAPGARATQSRHRDRSVEPALGSRRDQQAPADRDASRASRSAPTGRRTQSISRSATSTPRAWTSTPPRPRARPRLRACSRNRRDQDPPTTSSRRIRELAADRGVRAVRRRLAAGLSRIRAARHRPASPRAASAPARSRLLPPSRRTGSSTPATGTSSTSRRVRAARPLRGRGPGRRRHGVSTSRPSWPPPASTTSPAAIRRTSITRRRSTASRTPRLTLAWAAYFDELHIARGDLDVDPAGVPRRGRPRADGDATRDLADLPDLAADQRGAALAVEAVRRRVVRVQSEVPSAASPSPSRAPRAAPSWRTRCSARRSVRSTSSATSRPQPRPGCEDGGLPHPGDEAEHRAADLDGAGDEAAGPGQAGGAHPKIGYPDRWKDYSRVQIDRNSHWSNVVAGRRFRVDDDRGLIGQPVDRAEWGMTAPTVNAYFNPTLNEIVFPAGILQPPFFDAEMDDAVNYGATAATIGPRDDARLRQRRPQVRYGGGQPARLVDEKGRPRRVRQARTPRSS